MKVYLEITLKYEMSMCVLWSQKAVFLYCIFLRQPEYRTIQKNLY